MTGDNGKDDAADRDASAEGRDRAAELRDRGAESRDSEARRHEDLSRRGDSSEPVVDQSEQPVDSPGDDRYPHLGDLDGGSGGSSEMNRRSVLAREQSGRDRIDAAADREEAADDRQEAARERLGALRDRTEAALAAQRALSTLESMSDAFLTLDSEWRFTYLNPQTEAILERRREDLLNKNMWEEFPEAVGSRFEDAYRRAVEQQTTVRFEEHYAPLGRTLEIRVYPVPDGLAVYFRDVTNDRLRDAQHRQTQRLEALGQITAAVAHDFNNLLAAIRGYAELGAASPEPPKSQQYFGEILAASTRAVALTRQLLTFGREQTLNPSALDLNVAIEGVFSLLNQLLPPSIELQLVLADQPVIAFVDRSQLEHVLINMVVNARDAIDASGSITITTATNTPDGLIHDLRRPLGWIQVADTGSGIADDVLPHIFDPYFTTKAPEVGTGLGLATIYGIVSQSGGAIFVDSTVDLGTTMTIALPSSAAEETVDLI